MAHHSSITAAYTESPLPRHPPTHHHHFAAHAKRIVAAAGSGAGTSYGAAAEQPAAPQQQQQDAGSPSGSGADDDGDGSDGSDIGTPPPSPPQRRAGPGRPRKGAPNSSSKGRVTPSLPLTGAPDRHSPFVPFKAREAADLGRLGRVNMWFLRQLPRHRTKAVKKADKKADSGEEEEEVERRRRSRAGPRNLLKELREPSQHWAVGELWGARPSLAFVRETVKFLAAVGNCVHNKWRSVPQCVSVQWHVAVARLADAFGMRQSVVANALLVLFPLTFRADALTFSQGGGGIAANKSPCLTLLGAPSRLLPAQGAGVPLGAGSVDRLADADMVGFPKIKFWGEYPYLQLNKQTVLSVAHFVLWAYCGKHARLGDRDPLIVVMHICGCPACVDPKHLYYGTQSENCTKKHEKRVVRKGPYARRFGEEGGSLDALVAAVEDIVGAGWM
jgi:hypothetical protein